MTQTTHTPTGEAKMNRIDFDELPDAQYSINDLDSLFDRIERKRCDLERYSKKLADKRANLEAKIARKATKLEYDRDDVAKAEKLVADTEAEIAAMVKQVKVIEIAIGHRKAD